MKVVYHHHHNNNNDSSNNNNRSTITQTHYKNHTTQSYESGFFSEKGDYTAWLANKVHNKMRLRLNHQQQPQRRLLDVGGGTGNFTKMLLDLNPDHVEACVVDPFLVTTTTKHSDSSIGDSRITFVKAAAESFLDDNNQDQPNCKAAWWTRDYYHQILMKEMVHHIQAKDRVGVFMGMRQGTVVQRYTSSSSSSSSSSGAYPAILIVTRPHQDIDYPFWPAARRIWAAQQPSVDDIMADLECAGYSNIKVSMECYPCSIPLKRWLSMIMSRFWSTFSHFTDDQLDEGCEYIVRNEGERTDENGDLHFEDRLLFIAGYLWL